MIHLLDVALVAWLSTIDLPIDISVGPPAQSDAASRRAKHSALSLELHAVREQLDRRDNDVRDVRDAEGRVVERQRSTRWFELDYRCTVSGDQIEAHRVLGAILQLLVDHDVVPAHLVPVELAPPQLPIAVQVVTDDRSEVAAGIAFRAVIPVRPTAVREIAPPAVVLHFDVGPEPGRDDQAAAARGPVSASDPAAVPGRAWTTVRRREFIAGPRSGDDADGRRH